MSLFRGKLDTQRCSELRRGPGKAAPPLRCNPKSQHTFAAANPNEEVPTFLGAPLASCLRENNWSYSVPRTPSKMTAYLHSE